MRGGASRLGRDGPGRRRDGRDGQQMARGRAPTARGTRIGVDPPRRPGGGGTGCPERLRRRRRSRRRRVDRVDGRLRRGGRRRVRQHHPGGRRHQCAARQGRLPGRRPGRSRRPGSSACSRPTPVSTATPSSPPRPGRSPPGSIWCVRSRCEPSSWPFGRRDPFGSITRCPHPSPSSPMKARSCVRCKLVGARSNQGGRRHG